MKSKKVKLIVAMIIHFIILSIIIILVDSYFFTPSGLTYVPPVNNGYYKLEKFYAHHDLKTNFTKYYYEDSDEIKTKRYSLIEDNVDNIKKYINTSLNKLHELDNAINVDFDFDNVTSNDYSDVSAGNLYYYDVDNHILYIMDFYEHN